MSDHPLVLFRYADGQRIWLHIPVSYTTIALPAATDDGYPSERVFHRQTFAWRRRTRSARGWIGTVDIFVEQR